MAPGKKPGKSRKRPSSQRHPADPPTNAADRRDRMIGNAQYKMGEAEFFLGKLRSLDMPPKLEVSKEFHYYFSAFLSAARTPLEILRGQKSNPWIEGELASLPDRDQDLYTAFVELRNFSAHVEYVGPKEEIKMVPGFEAARREPRSSTGGSVKMPRMPGIPPTEVGFIGYKLQINGIDYPALECCENYLSLVKKLIEHRVQMPGW